MKVPSGRGCRPAKFWAALALSVLSMPVLAGCAGQSQEEVLREFALELPQCSTEDMTFSGSTDSSDIHLAMSFAVSRPCAEQYLKTHGVDLDVRLAWPGGEVKDGNVAIRPTDPPFSADAMEQFKLSLDPKKTYDVYLGFRTPKEAEFKVLLVPSKDKVGLYMEATSLGCVRGSGNAICPKKTG
ncbi:hypothetical protein [Streptomyces sp. NPDC004788]